jgi:hypothetical protein
VDFPHFNAVLTFAEGGRETAHVYQTPISPWNGITVVLATVCEDIEAVAKAFLPHGIYISHDGELLQSG